MHTSFFLIYFPVQTVLECLGGIVVHSFEEAIEVRSVFKTTFNEHFFNGILWVLEHLTSLLEALRIDKIHW